MPKFHSNNDVQIRLDTVWQNITKSDIIFLSKNIKVFQWLSKSKFYSFMNPNNGNQTKSDIFPWGKFIVTSSFSIKKIFHYLNDFQNQNFSVLWPHWTQTIEMKQNQTFFHEKYSNLTLFFVGHKILKYLNDFYNWHLSISLQKWAQTGKVKWSYTGHAQIWQYFSLFTMHCTI